MDNVKQKRVYEIYAYLLTYRIQNDIDELNKQVDEINAKIEEKKGSKLNANIFRNSSVKSLREKITYKEEYLKTLNSNLITNGLDISDITLTSLTNVINETFAEDTDFAQRYALLFQLINHPLYYNYAKKNFEQDEETREFSLSNISKFLGFDSTYYEKIKKESDSISKPLSFNISKSFFLALKVSYDVVKVCYPLSVPTFNPIDLDYTSYVTVDNNYRAVSTLGVSSLLSTKEISADCYLECLPSRMLILSDDAINALGYTIIMMTKFYQVKCGDDGKKVAKELIMTFLNWKHDYEMTILLGEERDISPDIIRDKFDTLNIISKELISISLL